MNKLTNEKVQEALHFLDKMKLSLKDEEKFKYNLNAFLSSARSITFYLQNRYNKVNNFEEWYQKKQQEMKSDDELRYLIEARNHTEKCGPLEMGETVRINFTARAYIGEPTKDAISKDLELEKLKKSNVSPTTTSRFFPENPEFSLPRLNIIDWSTRQLEKLEAIAKECKLKF